MLMQLRLKWERVLFSVGFAGFKRRRAIGSGRKGPVAECHHDPGSEPNPHSAQDVQLPDRPANLRRGRVPSFRREPVTGHHILHGRILPHPHHRHQLQRGSFLRQGLPFHLISNL